VVSGFQVRCDLFFHGLAGSSAVAFGLPYLVLGSSVISVVPGFQVRCDLFFHVATLKARPIFPYQPKSWRACSPPSSRE
jgi:hypothetical protein